MCVCVGGEGVLTQILQAILEKQHVDASCLTSS